MNARASEDANSTPPAAHASTRTPLARKVLIAMAIRLMAVTIALTGFGYLHVMRAITKQSMDGFAQYVHAKAARDSEMFRLAEDNHTLLRRAIIDALRAYGDTDPTAEFDKLCDSMANGSFISRKATFDGTKQASISSASGALSKQTAETRRLVLAARSVCESFGRAYQSRFLNTWFTTLDGTGVMFWPSRPGFAFEENEIGIADDAAGDDIYFSPATPEKNPERKSIWTKPYIDPVTHLPLVTLISPTYDGDEFLGVVGHDIALKELVNRAMQDRLEGTYNLVVRSDGLLVAHPHRMEEIMKAGGVLDISKSSDVELHGVYQAIANGEPPEIVLPSRDEQNLLGIERISGPNWFLVSVYPKKLVEDTAWSTARVILFGGIVSLVIELLLFYSLLKRRVTAPLGQLQGAIREVTEGKRAIALDTSRDDELGELAESFLVMAKAVDDREKDQKEAEAAIVVLNQELALNLEREKERNAQLLALQREVEDLSTPVLEVADRVLALPIIGLFDSSRSQKLMDRVLDAVVAKRARLVILDVTGTHDINDTATNELLKVVSAIRLLGAKCVLTGVRASIARSMVMQGADLQSVETLSSLGQALENHFMRQSAKTK